eukprot:360202-Chlamydomonas_euryale.AAC.9
MSQCNVCKLFCFSIAAANALIQLAGRGYGIEACLSRENIREHPSRRGQARAQMVPNDPGRGRREEEDFRGGRGHQRDSCRRCWPWHNLEPLLRGKHGGSHTGLTGVAKMTTTFRLACVAAPCNTMRPHTAPCECMRPMRSHVAPCNCMRLLAAPCMGMHGHPD